MEIGIHKTHSAPSPRHLGRTIWKNTAFGLAASIVQAATRFVMVPVVVYHLGLGGYGIWSIIMATAGYMRFGSAGIRSAFQKYVAEATVKGDFETASRLLSTGSICMLGLSVVGLIPLAMYSQSLAKASGVPLEFLDAAAGSIMLLAVVMALANSGAAFEGIVMGGHRIDLTRTFNIGTTSSEAVAIIALLHFGHGLIAMAVVMAISEVVYVLCCAVAARRILPQIHISPKYFSTNVFRELIRFAFSYQLVNILEVLYGMLVPVTILKYFGAELAGGYAVFSRLIGVAMMGQDALILPLLSGGTMVFATGSMERMSHFVRKSFKVSLATSLVPLTFVATFGPLVLLAWTGQTEPQFRTAIWFICLASLFQSLSRLQLILYRASGNSLHDNIRQAFRLGVLFLFATIGGLAGFNGLLMGLAVAELAGVTYMFFAMSAALPFFSPKHLIPDAIRLTGMTAMMIGVSIATTIVPLPWIGNERTAVLMKLGAVSLACLIASWPAVALTRALSTEEQRTLLSVLVPRKFAP